jgi:catalase (peroxidase I)
MTVLVNALKLIQPIKNKFLGVTFADLFKLAGAIAIDVH